MKQALPVVLKYLAVVAISCFLAFVISQNIASAQVTVPANVNNMGSNASSGAYKVESSVDTWRDAARSRQVPVKLYVPMPAPANSGHTKFPVILFSHGLGGSREGGKQWAAHWASHGFIVVAMQHIGSDEGLWKGASPRDIATKMKAGMTLSNLSLRVGDVGFVIDEVIRRSASGDTAFANADPRRIGMSGHSFGGQTTLAVTGQKSPMLGGQAGLDLRISAAIAFSPNARDKSNLARQFGEITLPFFSVTGSMDGSILNDDTKFEDRRLPYENMPAGQKYLAVFDGGDHMVFGGHALGARRPETARDKRIQLDVMAGTLAFWNATLMKDASARSWLDDGGYKATLGSQDIFERK